MPVYLERSDGGYTDTGADTTTSIQPVENGEPGTASVFGRPSENLRRRTVELARAHTELEDNLRALSGVQMSLVSDTVSNQTINDFGSGTLEKIIDPASGGKPECTSYFFYPNSNTNLLISSPLIPGGKVVITRANFLDFYDSSADDATTRNPDFGMNKPGDTIALRLATTNPLPSYANPLETVPAQDFVTSVITDEFDYAEITAGNVVSDGDSQLVKLPRKIRFIQSDAVDFETTLATFCTVTNVIDDPDNLFLRITENTVDWFDKGARGGKNGGAVYDQVKITKVIDAATLEVSSATPFRVLYGTADLAWEIYDNTGAATVATGVLGETGAAPSYEDELLIPIVTYTGKGFKFHHGNGYIAEGYCFYTEADTTFNKVDLPATDLGVKDVIKSTMQLTYLEFDSVPTTVIDIYGAYIPRSYYCSEISLYVGDLFDEADSTTFTLDIGTSAAPTVFLSGLDLHADTGTAGWYTIKLPNAVSSVSGVNLRMRGTFDTYGAGASFLSGSATAEVTMVRNKTADYTSQN